MSGVELGFENFLESVSPQYREFASQTHDYLLENGCKLKLALAKNGYVVSYSHGKNKRVLLNFVFRKSGMFTRVYGDCVNGYEDLLASLPAGMVKAIVKAPACKLCNPRCMGGYSFAISGEPYQKCRYNCFLFEVNDESIPFITAFIENEIKGRSA